MRKTKINTLVPLKYVVIVIAAIILIGIGIYQYAKKDSNLPTSAVINVQFADGTTKTFDSSTMAMGALYNPQTNTPVSSITTSIKVKPVVQASDGSYPTSLPAGYSLVSKSTSNAGVEVTGSTFNKFYWKDLTKTIATGAPLVPNTDNVILSSTISTSELDVLPSVMASPSNSNIEMRYKSTSLSDVTKVALVKPDGTISELSASSGDVATAYFNMGITLKKVTTSTYTLQSVTVNGGFT